MTLETERISRDYLYGRLLAIGERIERVALNVADEKRDTNAARLMQRFADRPASTWRSIELALAPYKTRLRARRPGFLHKMEERLDEVISAFTQEDFVDDRKLSGEFLLGYHCERRSLRPGDAGTLEANGETADNRTVEGGIS
jgi:CRISPR-associated protein Csd1